MGRWDKAAKKAMKEAKEGGYWGYQIESGEQYCVDCYGGQGSIPLYRIMIDSFSKINARCKICGTECKGVRIEKNLLEDS